MGDPNTEKEWVEEISSTVDEELESFTANTQYQNALLEILEEVYRYGGVAALNEVGEMALETIELGRHPKTSRVRRNARSLLINKYDADIPASSTLMKGSVG